MIIPDSLWTSEPDLGENSDACHIDESINFFGPHKCAHFSECSGARTCTWEGWCTGESGCESEYTAPVVPDHCNYNEALNVNGPNRCLYDNECAGERTCSSAGWCQGVSGCNRLLWAANNAPILSLVRGLLIRMLRLWTIHDDLPLIQGIEYSDRVSELVTLVPTH